MKTVRRDWLKKQIIAGKMFAKCAYHLTDDYAFDNANNFGETVFAPVMITDVHSEHSKNNVITLWSRYFEGKRGYASLDEDSGVYTLYVHSNLSYKMIRKEI